MPAESPSHPVIDQSARVVRRRRRLGIVAGAALLLVAALVGVSFIAAPLLRTYGIYLVPPSPQQYAEYALDDMNRGLEATPERYAEVRAKALSEVASATNYADTYGPLSEAATELGGPHTTFQDPAKASEMFGPSSGSSENQLPSVSSADGVTTIRLPTLIGGGTGSASFGQQYIDTVVNAIAKAAPTTSAWVVDLRDNHGGNVWPMLAAVAPLLNDGTVETFESADTSTAVSVDGGTVSSGRKQQSAASSPPEKTDERPIAVEINGMTGSSAEAVAIAFIGQSNVRVFGQPSYGFSTVNQPMRLYDGAVVNLTVAVDADRTGKRYGVPIEPDETVDDAQLPVAISGWLASLE
jgi:C-terminal processing protease CtpA/Prc